MQWQEHSTHAASTFGVQLPLQLQLTLLHYSKHNSQIEYLKTSLYFASFSSVLSLRVHILSFDSYSSTIMVRHCKLALDGVPEGVGLGVVATHPIKAGDIISDEEAYFRLRDERWRTDPQELVRLFMGVEFINKTLLENAPDRAELEGIIFRTPPQHVPFDAIDILVTLERHYEEFSELDRATQSNQLNGFINFMDGLRSMQDSVRDYSGFSVFGSLLNHSCIPTALFCISAPHDETLQDVEFTTGTIQVRALSNIEPGDEITISYWKHIGINPQLRRKYLKNEFGFDCKCKYCKEVDPEVDQKLCDLLTAYRNVLNPGHSYATSYRAGYTVLSIAMEMGWNDIFLLRTFESLRYKAEQNQDRLRFIYFANKANEWCALYLPENHQRSSITRTIYGFPKSLGVPLVPGVGSQLRLIYMLDHPAQDPTYYFLHLVEDRLEELPNDQNKLLCDWAASALYPNATEVEREDDILSCMIHMFKTFEADLARASLLQELAAFEVSSTAPKPARKKKTKTQKKQAAETTKSSDSLPNKTRSSLPEPPLPASAEIPSDVTNTRNPLSPEDETDLPPRSSSLGLNPTGREPMEIRKTTKEEKKRELQRKKRKSAALRKLQHATPAQKGSAASGHVASAREYSQIPSHLAAPPLDLLTPPNSDSKPPLSLDRLFPSSAPAEKARSHGLPTPEHTETKNELESAWPILIDATGWAEIGHGSHISQSLDARSETEPGSPALSARDVNTPSKTPLLGGPATIDTRNEIEPKFPGPSTTVGIDAPSHVLGAVSFDLESTDRTVASGISAPLGIGTPFQAPPFRPVPINPRPIQPPTGDSPLLSPRVYLPDTQANRPLPSYRFLCFSNETTRKEWQVTYDHRLGFDVRYYGQQRVFDAIVEDRASAQPREWPELRGRRFSFDPEPSTLQDSIGKQFRRVRKSDPCDASPTTVLNGDDEIGTESLEPIAHHDVGYSSQTEQSSAPSSHAEQRIQMERPSHSDWSSHEQVPASLGSPPYSDQPVHVHATPTKPSHAYDLRA